LFILFTGLRRDEAVKLTWDQVDFNSRILTIADTKNRLTHVLPMSSFLYDLLLCRRSQCTTRYVFPGDGKTGYVVEPRKAMQKIIVKSGVSFTLHDLRRTFITLAESLDIPAYALKRLLNHKMNNDVTAGYIVMDVERLRKPMQMIADHLMKLMGIQVRTEMGITYEQTT
jgi:integrase